MDEATLLKSAKKLDQGALMVIFDRLAPQVYRYAFHTYFDADLADRIVGDVFSQLLENLVNEDAPSFNLRVYIFQIAYQKIVDRGDDDLPVIRNHESMVGTNFRDFTHTMQAEEHEPLLLEFVNVLKTELNAFQRHTLLLRYLEDFTLNETALIIGKSVSNVKVIQNRALAKLKQKLDFEVGSSKQRQAFGIDP